MAFVNEYIPEEDLKKYNFAELNKRPRKGGSSAARDWTINREADIWLHEFYTEFDHTAPDGGYTGISVWNYYWKGTLMLVEVKGLEAGGGRGKHCWSRKKLLSINIPPELESQCSQILKDLEAAFTAYKDGGVFSSSTSFSFTLEV
jgi:hypothetical protein